MLFVKDIAGQAYSVTVDDSQNLVLTAVELSTAPSDTYLTDISGAGTVWKLGAIASPLQLTGDPATLDEDTQPFVELNDNWILFALPNGNLLAKQKIPSAGDGIELLVEIFLDEGRERYSMSGLAMRSHYWDPRLLSIGGFNRNIPAVPGEFSVGRVSISLNNADDYFSKKLASSRFYKRRMNILMGDLAASEEDFRVIFSGIIQTWDSDEEKFTISATDNSLEWLDNPIDWRIDFQTFPEKPEDTPTALAPFIMGTVENATGAIPAYLVDAAQSQSKFRYIASIFALKEITGVFQYKEEVTTGFAVSQQTIGGREYTVIDFDADPRDPQRASEREITFNAKGITYDGTPSGTLIENPVDQWKEFLLLAGIGVTQIEDSKFDAAKATYDLQEMKGGVVIAGDIGQTIRDVQKKIALSFNIHSFPARDGSLSVAVPLRLVETTTGLHELTDSINIIEGSFSIGNSRKIASTLEVSSTYDWALKQYDFVLPFEDTAQTAAQRGRTTISRQMPYNRDSKTLVQAISDVLFFVREERQVVDLAAAIQEYRQIDVGDIILLNHRAGIAADGLGYQQKPFFVLGVGIAGSRGQFRTIISCVDLQEALPPETQVFLDFGVEAKPFLTNRQSGWYDELEEEPLYNLQLPHSGA